MAIEPSKIIIGDTLNWVREHNSVSYINKDGETVECPSSSWTLTYEIRGPQGQITLTAVATSNDFEILAESTQTQKWVEGTYNWAAYASHTTGAVVKRYQIDSGTMDFEPNLVNVGIDYDGRSHIKRVLDGLEAIIEGRAEKATMDWVSYSIAGCARSIDPRELRIWYSQYKWLYKKEQVQNLIDNEEDTPRILVELS